MSEKEEIKPREAEELDLTKNLLESSVDGWKEFDRSFYDQKEEIMNRTEDLEESEEAISKDVLESIEKYEAFYNSPSSSGRLSLFQFFERYPHYPHYTALYYRIYVDLLSKQELDELTIEDGQPYFDISHYYFSGRIKKRDKKKRKYRASTTSEKAEEGEGDIAKATIDLEKKTTPEEDSRRLRFIIPIHSSSEIDLVWLKQCCLKCHQQEAELFIAVGTSETVIYQQVSCEIP